MNKLILCMVFLILQSKSNLISQSFKVYFTISFKYLGVVS